MIKRISLMLFSLTACLYAQETILAVGERLVTIKLGDSSATIQYDVTEEGFFSPNGPFIDGSGVLYFFPTYNREYLIKYVDRKFDRIGLLRNRSDYEKLVSASYVFVSQQGTISVPGNGLTFNYYANYFREDYFDWGKGKIRSTDYTLTPVPNGIYLKSMSQDVSLCAEFETDGTINVRYIDDARSWLASQPGGFSIGSDGLLYRNGVLWSAQWPKGLEQYDVRYLGRLMSGHCIWSSGSPESSAKFMITDAMGNIELIVKIPVTTPYNYGLGPWGEFYYLHAPPMDKRYDPMGPYVPDTSFPAELAVYRTHLKYFGRLNVDSVRLRKEASTSSAIIGTYPAKTGFRILETGTVKETIGGTTNVWYKVRLLDGTEGWFFGAFVANLYDGPGTPPPWPNVADW